MAQESFDSLTPGSGRQLAQDSADTRQIKGEIEKTRTEMRETISEIQDRLRPDHLLQQARDGVTQAAAGKARTMMNSVGDTASTVAARTRDAGNYVADYAIEHPIRIAIAVGAVTWWMLRGRGHGYDTYYGASDTNWDDAEVDYADYGDGRSMRERVGDYAANARSTVSDYASSARDTIGEYAGSARDSARHAGMRVRSAASSATTSTRDWMSDNPLAAGAIALAVGVAIGLSAPRTDFEDDAIGETRDRAWERTSQMAKNLTDTVGQKVATAAENLVGDSIKTAATTSPEPMGRA